MKNSASWNDFSQFCYLKGKLGELDQLFTILLINEETPRVELTRNVDFNFDSDQV